ncbi:ankyrin repeat domain-containing protein, partial [Wolbachia pipientis]
EALATWNMTRNKIENNRRYEKQSTDVWDIMAYFAPDKIRIEEIFSKLIADDKEKLWSAVELLNKYKMVNLEAGIANIHELVQEITRLKLQKAGKEEEILRRALELINSGRVVKSTSHVTSVWGYASNHGRLIDDFYFNSSYIHRETFFIKESTPLHLLAESGDCKAINAIIAHIEKHYPNKLGEIVNVENNHGQTPLHIAAENGKLDVTQHLVSKGADINAKDSVYGSTPFHAA